MTVSRAEALEAGMYFMTWLFSEGTEFSREVRRFADSIGLGWQDFDDARGHEGGTIMLIDSIRRATSPDENRTFAWFEVGRNSVLLANLIGTGTPPSSLVDAALAGYRRYLEDAQVRFDDRDRLQGLLSSMATGDVGDKKRALGELKERLRDLALSQEQGVAAVAYHVTLNFDNGSTFTGPLLVGHNIQSAYQAATEAPTNDLKQRVEEVVRLASRLIESIENPTEQNDVSAQLKSFAEEVKKENPSRWMLDISSEGLIEAAKTVAALAAPITTAVKAVLALVTP